MGNNNNINNNPFQAINSAIGSTLSAANQVSSIAQAILSLTNQADIKDIFPTNCLGKATREILAGPPKIEAFFHPALEQGRFLEKSLGDAQMFVMKEKADLEAKIQTYLHLNTLATDGQWPLKIRKVKYVADAIKFIKEVQKFLQDYIALIAAIQANIVMLQAVESQMLNMFRANANALANLLQQICNFGLPSLPSLAAQLGLWHWNGYKFNTAAGFNFNPNLSFNFNFNFNQCLLAIPNFSGLFNLPVLSITDGQLTYTQSAPVPSTGGVYGDPSQFTNPSYITQMQDTTTLVLNPDLPQNTVPPILSLPSPKSIISNYSLTPAVYQQNITSVVPTLNSIVIQPGDPDYSAGIPSVTRLTSFRNLLINEITLNQIVIGGYAPNTIAAWLFYLQANRSGRGGQWLKSFQLEYNSTIVPSLTYLLSSSIPWNTVLGGNGTSDAPSNIPLVTLFNSDTTNNLKWRLSYIEASLLGYPRNTTWDSAADTTYLSNFTGSDLDYKSNAVSTTISTQIVGEGTAAYPSTLSYPISITSILNEVIEIATVNIENDTNYQSSRPQSRYIYDMFANAQLIDRFSQFWKDFNSNLISLLSQDPYVVSYVVSYVDTLNGVLNPLAGSHTDYTAIETDASSRNRSWTPGSSLLLISKAMAVSYEYSEPTNNSNGWTTGNLDPVAYLARPDVSAQSLPVQYAMLRTNQNYAALQSSQGDVLTAIRTSVNNSLTAAQTLTVTGWEATTTINNPVPPGSIGLVVPFDSSQFNNIGFITNSTQFTIQQTASYVISADLLWDTSGPDGTRTVTILANGVSLASVSVDSSYTTPYESQIVTVNPLNIGDIITIQATHSLATPQNILVGSNILGLLSTDETGITSVPNETTSNSNSLLNTQTFIAGGGFEIFTSISIGSDGFAYPTDPTVLNVAPSPPPVIDGLALQQSSGAGSMFQVLMTYGSIVTTPGFGWVAGGLVYVTANGTLTQDLTQAFNNNWLVIIGKATGFSTIVYEPQLPTPTS